MNLPRLDLNERLSRLKGISPGMIPEQHSDRLQAGELCFACLIGLLFGDPRQRPANRAPSTAGACNAEASRSHSGGWGQFYLGAPGNWVSFQSALTPFA